MNDTRPLHKRAKFMAFALALVWSFLCLLVTAFLDVRLPDNAWMAIFGAIPIGLPMFQLAQGNTDTAAKRAQQAAYEGVSKS